MVRLIARSLANSAEAIAIFVVLLLVLSVFYGVVIFYAELGTYNAAANDWLRPTGTGARGVALPLDPGVHVVGHRYVLDRRLR